MLDPAVLTSLAAYARDPTRAASLLPLGHAPGLANASVHPCRSVAEAHLYLDLLGWPPGRRGQRLVQVDGRLVSEYQWPEAPAGRPGRIRVDIPMDALSNDGFGGPALSRMIDPAGWLFAADLLCGGVPAPTSTLEPTAARRARGQLSRAADCLDQAQSFAEGGDRVGADAFFTTTGRLLWSLEPARFDVARLGAVAAAWRRLASKFEAVMS